MSLAGLFTLLTLIAGLFIAFGRGRFMVMRQRAEPLTTTPLHYGIFIALTSFIITLTMIVIWLAVDSYLTQIDLAHQLRVVFPDYGEAEISMRAQQLQSNPSAFLLTNERFAALYQSHLAQSHLKTMMMNITAIALMIVVAISLFFYIKPRHLVHKANEMMARRLMFACACVAIVITLGVILSLIFETAQFFSLIAPTDFFFGLEWSPQISLRDDQVATHGRFGAVPIFVGTLLVTLIAIFIAGPIGLMSAIYMSEYAHSQWRDIAKPILEILAGIPTVVYGFFAALTIAPLIQGSAQNFGLDASSESALAAGIVMGIMIIPFISSLSDDVICAVPNHLREASFALGATHAETILKVVLPAALPGIMSSFLLALSRAIGETMIVVMAAGLAANLTFNPFEAVTTVTVQIVTLLVGDQEFSSPKTLAAFALGMTLFIITLIFNSIALMIVRKYKEQYE